MSEKYGAEESWIETFSFVVETMEAAVKSWHQNSNVDAKVYFLLDKEKTDTKKYAPGVNIVKGPRKWKHGQNDGFFVQFESPLLRKEWFIPSSSEKGHVSHVIFSEHIQEISDFRNREGAVPIKNVGMPSSMTIDQELEMSRHIIKTVDQLVLIHEIGHYWKVVVMGRVRTKTVKKSFRQVIGRYYSKMILDFHTNKKILEEVAIIPSKSLQNKIAGFSTHLMKRLQKGPVRRISLKLEEERERRMDFVPDESAIRTDRIEVDKETIEILASLGMSDLPGIELKEEQTPISIPFGGERGGFGGGGAPRRY